MNRLTQLLFPIIFISILSCKKDHSHKYTITDFRNALQPHLIRIVSKGVVMYSDSSMRHMATDRELLKLSQSEHPVLRASSLSEMLRRKTFNQYNILISRLDDTATVRVAEGEFGIFNRTVSDYMLEVTKWETLAEKNKIIEEVITKHNYLKSAYTIVSKIDPQEKFYPYIKAMAIRKPEADEYDEDKIFRYTESALFGLAQFKKKEDIQIIKDQMLGQNSWVSFTSFDLMQKFQDTAYMEVYEDFYPRNFYRSICLYQNHYSSIDFINSIASYKNIRSAKILASILNRKPFVPCLIETAYIKRELVQAIWKNKCEAYTKLRKQIENSIPENQKKIVELPIDTTSNFSRDTSFQKFRW